VDLLVGVLIVSALVNLGLLTWASQADHVTLRWPRFLQGAMEKPRSKAPSPEIPTVRRRTLYVAEHQPRPTIASSAPQGPGRHPSSPPLAETPPPDPAELPSKPAEIAPHADGFGSAPSGDGGNGHARPSVEPGSDSGPTILANLAQHRNGTVPAAAGAGLAADSLTSLEGPTAWSRILEIENARLLRYRRPVTIVVADVEGLRRLAERLGEVPVQRLLPVIADAFVRQTRTTDWIARVGEGRFRALLPETDEIQAINYVERVRTACEPWLASAAVPLNLAIGWSSPAGSSDLDSAIRRAEERMHADRQTAGRLD
jgi:diguanylate cyclase (GGDEF)-like protein